MLKLDTRDQLWIGLALVLLMALTRVQTGALGHTVPDASFAVFFLAGLYLRPAWALPALFGLGFAIDLAAVGWANVSAYCLSPAYLALVPAYAAMWGAGRWYGERHQEALRTLLPLGASLAVGVSLAELFASGGFYLFSDRFAEPTLAGLAGRLVEFFPTTLATLALYVALAIAAHVAVAAAVRSHRARGLNAG
jgi:hypothetical protein